MGDLHSIAFTNHNTQIMSSQLYMENVSGYTSPPPAASVFCHSNAPNYNYSSSNYYVGEEECDRRREYNLSSSFSDNVDSSGYLEDVLMEFSSKRRRLDFLFTDDDDDEQHFRYISEKNCSTTLDFMDHTINPGRISDMKAPDHQEAISAHTYEFSSSSYTKSTRWNRNKEKSLMCDPGPSCASGVTTDKITKKTATIAKVVYPFAVVKPGGFEGDATLNDINKRILMAPTRPIHHPVGDFACRPMVVSPQGPGLSGKDVIAFTRLHTQGRGTITIIRTRG